MLSSELDICIMAGGTGTRLWPVSRKSYPKQFIKSEEGYSLFQSTIKRISDLDYHKLYIVCSEQHRFIVSSQLEDVGVSDYVILLESEGKGTTVAIGAITLFSEVHSEASNICILSSDHHMDDDTAFREDVVKCVDQSNEYDILLLGKQPTSPATGYGYIQVGSEETSSIQKVLGFKEKPDVLTAQAYLAESCYLWNCGIFIFNKEKLLKSYKKYIPGFCDEVSSLLSDGNSDGKFFRLTFPEDFSEYEESFDRAIVEKLDNSGVKSLSTNWTDVGSWLSYSDVFFKDSGANNKHIGNAEFYQSHNNYVYSNTDKLIACVDVDDLVIVDTPDAILVSSKKSSEYIKDVVNDLSAKEYYQASSSKKVHRPWGAYDSIDNGLRHQVKRITVTPGQKLSLQKHYHRSEHWIVVSGSALVTLGDEVKLITENESIYIPLGTVHRLENPGNIPLELIEVQTGSYLGEDDIVRFDDNYGRV